MNTVTASHPFTACRESDTDAGISVALIDAAEMLLGSPMPERAWKRACARLQAGATPAQWFDAARDVLCVELTPVPPGMQLVAGTYVVRDAQGWRRFTTSMPRPAVGGAVDVLELHRVVRRYAHAPLNLATFRRLIGDNSRVVSTIVWTSLLANLLALAVPLYMNAIYDRVLPAHAQASLWTLSIGVVLAIAVELMLRTERVHALVGMANVVQCAVEPDLIRRLVHQDLETTNERPVAGAGHVQALGQWERLRTHYWQIASGPAIDSAFTIIYVAVIAWIAGPLALVVVLGLLASAAVVWRADFHQRRAEESDGAPFRLTPSGLVNTRAANAEPQLVNAYLLHSEGARQREQARFRILQQCTTRLAAISNAQTTAVVVAAFYLIGAQMMTAAGIFATVLLGARALQPVGGWISALPALRQVRAALQQLDGVLEQGSNVSPTPAPAPERGTPGWQAVGVDIGYTNNHRVLRDLDLIIQPGERVAIVGAEGAGKSALLRTLMGIVPVQKGSLYLADRPLRNAAEALRNRTHFAWQGAEPLGRTILDFLQLEGPVDIARIHACAEEAGLESLLGVLPNGLDTEWSVIRPMERQKIRERFALWRLLLSNREVLVLDEPSECLDQQGETALLAYLKRRCSEGATLLLATGRSRLLEAVDRVILLDRGRVTFDGPTKNFVSGTIQ